MRPAPSTVGVNLTPTPYSRSCRVTKLPPPPVPTTGIKILPPAKKLASCPLMAMMLGSASTLNKSSVLVASTVTELPLSPVMVKSLPESALSSDEKMP